MLDQKSLELLFQAVKRLDSGFAGLPAHESEAQGIERIAEALHATADRLQDNYPYFHPLYAGQMLKPPHPVARLAYALAMWINPNNHALDGGRATSAMEKEAVGEIAGMYGWKNFLGHLCGGGTMANLEALWVAGQLHPGKKILASEQAHYTHGRISGVLQLPFEVVACDSRGRINASALAKRVERGDVGTVVATMGTTATGSVDPLPDILAIREKHAFRVHADAAYGGYFVLTENLEEEAKRAFARVGEADSIVIDPHKHGLQPYGCGCVFFRDAGVGRLYKHDSPYTYFSSAELHLGEISLECSRPGAAAAALWATRRIRARIGMWEASGVGSVRKSARGSTVYHRFCAGTGHCRICAQGREHQRGFRFKSQGIRGSSQTRSASGSGGIAGSFLGGKSGSDEARSGNNYLFAVGALETAAPRLGGPDLGIALLGCERSGWRSPLIRQPMPADAIQCSRLPFAADNNRWEKGLRRYIEVR
jgi:tyrosine decarboxylase/aspartate 1-decarboxylase